MIVIGECTMRIAFEEIDYLRPTLISHPHLRHAIQPHSSGHDAWGFRNERVPISTEILTIGDSLTYGVAATADESWPSWLQRLSGKKVYNLALGGFGTSDYEWLLKHKAYQLKPKTVYIAIYLGNDLYRKQIGNEKRAQSPTIQPPSRFQGWAGLVREYLSRNSMLYQVTKLNLSRLAYRLKSMTTNQGNTALIPLHFKHINTVLTPRRFPQEEDEIKLGMSRATNDTKRMMTECSAQPYDCVFLILPTKESVYYDLAREALSATTFDPIRTQDRAEAIMRNEISSVINERGFVVIDLLPSMKNAATLNSLYPENDDGHPNGTGYRVMANAIAQTL